MDVNSDPSQRNRPRETYRSGNGHEYATPQSGEADGDISRYRRSRRQVHLTYLRGRERMFDERMGDALGWLSIGLGVAALLAPRALSRATGMVERPALLRAIGLRELVSGAGLLTQKRRAPWLWARVAGDVFDTALVGAAALRPHNPHRGRSLGALAVLAPIGAIDLAASLRQSGPQAASASRTGGHEAFLEQSLIVSKSPQECYAFWRDLTNLPRFIPELEAVTVIDSRTSHWVLRAAGGVKLEWDSEITADHEGERIGWRSRDGSAIRHAGTVRFDSAPGGRGCIVRLLMRYEPPIGRAGVGVAKLLGRDPEGESREHLRRFRQLLETGEIPTTEGQPSGRRSWLGQLTPEGRKSRPGRILQESAS